MRVCQAASFPVLLNVSFRSSSSRPLPPPEEHAGCSAGPGRPCGSLPAPLSVAVPRASAGKGRAPAPSPSESSSGFLRWLRGRARQPLPGPSVVCVRPRSNTGLFHRAAPPSLGIGGLASRQRVLAGGFVASSWDISYVPGMCLRAGLCGGSPCCPEMAAALSTSAAVWKSCWRGCRLLLGWPRRGVGVPRASRCPLGARHRPSLRRLVAGGDGAAAGLAGGARRLQPRGFVKPSLLPVVTQLAAARSPRALGSSRLQK